MFEELKYSLNNQNTLLPLIINPRVYYHQLHFHSILKYVQPFNHPKNLKELPRALVVKVLALKAKLILFYGTYLSKEMHIHFHLLQAAVDNLTPHRYPCPSCLDQVQNLD